MLTQPDPEALAAIDWGKLERVRQHAESVGPEITKKLWQALFAEALLATGGRRGPALDQLALYGAPEWVPPAAG